MRVYEILAYPNHRIRFATDPAVTSATAAAAAIDEVIRESDGTM